MKHFVFVIDKNAEEIVRYRELDISNLSPKEIAAWSTTWMSKFEREYPGEQYETVSGSASSLERFFSSFPEYSVRK